MSLPATIVKGWRSVEPSLTVVIDFAGPNVAKPMHVGHLRATIIGDSLRRLFRFVGHRVIGDPHFGDWGLQMGQLIAELEHRRPDLPYFDPDSTGPYPDDPPLSLDELIDLYPEAVRRCSTDPRQWQLRKGPRPTCSGAVPVTLRCGVTSSRSPAPPQEADFDDLGVHFDLWMGESDVEGRIPEMLERVRASGAAEESEGALIVRVDLPDDRMEIPPLLLVTSRGSYLYSTTDLATDRPAGPGSRGGFDSLRGRRPPIAPFRAGVPCRPPHRDRSGGGRPRAHPIWHDERTGRASLQDA